MGPLLKTLGMFAAGAAAMYYFDPVAGRRRRALVRERGLAAGRQAGQNIAGGLRDAGERVRGSAAQARAAVAGAAVDDERLVERVRSQLGHWVDAPRRIEVEAVDGCVILSGEAAAQECAAVADRVGRIPGVRQVDNRLTVSGADDASGAAPRH